MALATRMRRGEILGLRWRDVDMDGASLSVAQALEQTSEGLAFKTPKTDRSRRTIALPSSAMEALRAHRKAQREERLKLGPLWRDQDLVCAAPDGGPWSPRDVTKAFSRVVAALGLPVRLHDLRHTHATMLLKAGTHPKVASERLGHASVSITLDTYSHVVEGMQSEAARAIDDALRQALES